MHRIIVGDETNLGTSTSWKVIQTSANGLSSALQHSTTNRHRTDINDKKVGWLLRWSDHVFSWSDKLHHSLAELRTLLLVSTVALFIQMTKVVGRTIVQLRTNVTTPSATILHPCHKRVNVGTTSLTTNDTGVARLHRVNFLFLRSSWSQWANDTTDGDLGLRHEVRRSGNLCTRESAHTLRNLDGKVNILFNGSAHPRHSWCGSHSWRPSWSRSALHLPLRRISLIEWRGGTLWIQLALTRSWGLTWWKWLLLHKGRWSGSGSALSHTVGDGQGM